MKTRNFFAKVAFTAASIILLTATISQDAFADHSRRSFTGSWIVDIVPTQPGPPAFTNLATISKGGTMLTSDPIVGSGNGIWKRSGRRDFEVKFLVLVPLFLPTGTPPDIVALAGTMLTVTAYVTVGQSGDDASGVVDAVYANVDGIPVAEVEGEVFWTRIDLD